MRIDKLSMTVVINLSSNHNHTNAYTPACTPALFENSVTLLFVKMSDTYIRLRFLC